MFSSESPSSELHFEFIGEMSRVLFNSSEVLLGVSTVTGEDGRLLLVFDDGVSKTKI